MRVPATAAANNAPDLLLVAHPDTGQELASDIGEHLWDRYQNSISKMEVPAAPPAAPLRTPCEPRGASLLRVLESHDRGKNCVPRDTICARLILHLTSLKRLL